MAGRPRTREPKSPKAKSPVPAAHHSPIPQPNPLESTPGGSHAQVTPEARPGPGRPSSFDPALADLAQRCGKANLTDEQMAIMMGISPRTFYNWRNEHPEFLQWVKEGQTDKKARLRASAYQRAFGFTVMEEKVFLHEGKPVVHPTPKYYPPSDTMLIFLLCNALPEEFKHVQHIQNAGGVDVNLKGTVAAPMLKDLDRILAAMGERPAAAGQAPAPAPARPSKAPGKPGKAAAPARSQDLAQEDDEDVPLEPPDLDDDLSPETSLDLSGLEGGDE